jgi:hypothetical protein
MTDTKTDKHGYPTEGFFVAHKRFIGRSYKNGYAWGSITDGPVVDEEELIDLIIHHWSDEMFAPDRDDLRVWYIVPGKVAEDCTAWAVKTTCEAIQLQVEGF